MGAAASKRPSRRKSDRRSASLVTFNERLAQQLVQMTAERDDLRLKVDLHERHALHNTIAIAIDNAGSHAYGQNFDKLVKDVKKVINIKRSVLYEQQ